MTDALRIGDVARAAGVNVQTLRYYERRRLVVPRYRHSGQREYEAADVSRVRTIKSAQRLGFTLDEVQELFDLSAHRRGTGELQAKAVAKIAEIDGRIAKLQAMRAELAGVVDANCDSLIECSCGLARPLPFSEIAAEPSSTVNRTHVDNGPEAGGPSPRSPSGRSPVSAGRPPPAGDDRGQ